MKLQSLDGLKALKNNSTEYKGELKTYQTIGKTKYQQVRLNNYQDILYKRALYGLSVYEQKDVKKMHWEKKRRIKRLHKKAQSSINVYKQEVVNALCTKLFGCFHNSTLAESLFSEEKSEIDPEFINTLELKSLGITKQLIVNRFVEEGILPKDFYKLKKAG